MRLTTPTAASISTVTSTPTTTTGDGVGRQSDGSTLYSANIASSSGERGRMGRQCSAIVVLVLLGSAVQAQAPALSAILQQAKAAREASQAVMLATPEGKAYLAAAAVERGLEQRIAAEAKEAPK
jgi:hypothetical protein